MEPDENPDVQEVTDEEILNDSVDMAGWPGNNPELVAEIDKNIEVELKS